MTQTTELEERVQRGAAWLDSVRPGWEWDIDPASLNLSDSHRCVLGQVGRAVAQAHGVTLACSGFLAITQDSGHGGCLATLANAVDREYTDEWTCSHGFEISSGPGARYSDLDDLWIDAIKDRVNR